MRSRSLRRLRQSEVVAWLCKPNLCEIERSRHGSRQCYHSLCLLAKILLAWPRAYAESEQLCDCHEASALSSSIQALASCRRFAPVRWERKRGARKIAIDEDECPVSSLNGAKLFFALLSQVRRECWASRRVSTCTLSVRLAYASLPAQNRYDSRETTHYTRVPPDSTVFGLL